MLSERRRLAAGNGVQRSIGRRYGTAVQLREIMTSGVVTAAPESSASEVAQQMRDHNVGSVVIVEPDGFPIAMVTDRDLAMRVLAEDADPDGADRRARIAAAGQRRA